ncbi:TPA: hypothetical protein ACP32N_003185 [Pseudomonas aeruginosa]
MKASFAKVDAALDVFWIDVVLHAYHRFMSKLYGRKAERLARKVMTRANEQRQSPVIQVRSKEQFWSHRHQVLRHNLEADLIRGKTC